MVRRRPRRRGGPHLCRNLRRMARHGVGWTRLAGPETRGGRSRAGGQQPAPPATQRDLEGPGTPRKGPADVSVLRDSPDPRPHARRRLRVLRRASPRRRSLERSAGTGGTGGCADGAWGGACLGRPIAICDGSPAPNARRSGGRGRVSRHRAAPSRGRYASTMTRTDAPIWHGPRFDAPTRRTAPPVRTCPVIATRPVCSPSCMTPATRASAPGAAAIEAVLHRVSPGSSLRRRGRWVLWK